MLILGSGPNRIGQGIEFDYSCVHAVMALREAGYETVMVNCNPETVSTDYDTADRLYFEPLTFEDVLEVCHAEDTSGRAAGGPGVVGVIVQLGGQTPLGLAQRLKDAGRADRRHLARSRSTWPRTAARSARLLAEAGLRAPAHGTATSSTRPRRSPTRSATRCWSGRPTCSAAGAWRSSTTTPTLRDYIGRATDISPEHPVLVDRFLDDAIEIDVDALCDADGEVYLGGVMEHIEEAGIHSGDSACALPPITLAAPHLAEVRALHRGDRPRRRRARPAQRAVRAQGRRALRAGGQPARVAHRAVRLQGDRGAAGQGGGPDHARRDHRRAARRGPAAGHRRRRAAARRTRRSRSRRRCCRSSGSAPRPGKGVDILLGPEMKSTGEVMGIDTAFGHAFAKSQAAAYGSLPTTGKIFVSVANRDKRGMIFPVKRLADLGFDDRRHRRHRRGAAPPRHRLRDRAASTTRPARRPRRGRR